MCVNFQPSDEMFSRMTKDILYPKSEEKKGTTDNIFNVLRFGDNEEED